MAAGDENSVKRIQLPSGRTIEIVFFHVNVWPSSESAPADGSARELQRCPECGSDLVYPLEWHEADDQGWSVTLRCPACERRETGVFAQDALEAFDEELDRGTQMLIDDLGTLTRENMILESERFAAALQCGAILPMDF
jgi:hypothetical protein